MKIDFTIQNMKISTPYDDLIRECPSIQAREYMENKIKKQAYNTLLKAFDEIDQEITTDLKKRTPTTTGHIHKTTTEQIKKQIQHNYEENKKKEMELFYKGVPIKIRYNRGNEKLWEETRE